MIWHVKLTRHRLVTRMKKIIGAGILLSFFGCATQQTSTTTFLAQEKAVVQVCIRTVSGMSVPDRFTVDPLTGQSPMRAATQCYADQLKSVAHLSAYSHSYLVDQYADYLTRLMASQDRGEVPKENAIAWYGQAWNLFRKSIDEADAKIATQNRKEFFRRLAVASAALAEQERQRAAADAANRPVLCTYTGIYTQTGVICH